MYLEGAHERLVHAHHPASVVKLPAVVGGREEGHQLPLGKELVAVLHHLVGPTDEVEVVSVQELADHVVAGTLYLSPSNTTKILFALKNNHFQK